MTLLLLLIGFLTVTMSSSLETCPFDANRPSSPETSSEETCGSVVQQPVSLQRKSQCPCCADDTKMSTSDRTFIMVKHDGVQRGLVGEILKRFEQRGLKLVGLKFTQPARTLIEKHYEEHNGKPFFAGLVDYGTSGPVAAMVFQGFEAVKVGRSMTGATKPVDSAPGTIRGDFGLQVGRNLIHASDSNDSAKREIALWFSEAELHDWKQCNNAWLYE